MDEFRALLDRFWIRREEDPLEEHLLLLTTKPSLQLPVLSKMLCKK